MKINVYEPLAEFVGQEKTWSWIEDYSENKEYEELDDILKFLNGEIPRRNLPDSLRTMDGSELREEYARRFPLMLGKALQLIGKDFETGNIKLEVEFTSLQKLVD